MRVFLILFFLSFSLLMAAQTDTNLVRYNELMQQGDVAFALRNYDQAIEKYSAASKIFPERTEPKKKLADAKHEKETEPALKSKKQYNEYMTNGDRAVAQKKFDLAETEYRNALSAIPGDPAAIARLKEIAPKLAEVKYTKNMRYGDTAFARNNFSWAQTCYKRALDNKPGDTAAFRKMNLAASRIDPAAVERDRKYKEFMSLGAAFDEAGDHENALKYYREALKQKPSDEVALHQVKHAEEHIKEEQLTEAIRKGDSLYKAQAWQSARCQYLIALSADSTDSVAKIRRADCDEMLAPPLKRKDEKKFSAAMKKGQAALDSGNCSEAQKQFAAALAIKPRHPLARDKKNISARCR